MDAIWTALDGAKPSRRAEFEQKSKEDWRNEKKTLDWMTM
jgi:hypothetical protein